MTADLPPSWKNIPEKPRSSIWADYKTMLNWQKSEWASDMANEIAIPGINEGAPMSMVAIMPKGQGAADEEPNVGEVAVFLNYWGDSPIVELLKRHAANFLDIYKSGTSDAEAIEAEVGTMFWNRGYTVGTAEEHHENIFDMLLGVSSCGTSVKAYKRPGARGGTSHTAIHIMPSMTPPGHEYMQAAVEMLKPSE